MIKAFYSLNTNIRKSNETSFSGRAETNYVNSNEYIKDEFVKNIEDEKKSIITWANDRIGKLDSILKAIAQNDEMTKSEKPIIAATAGDEILKNTARELKNNPYVSPEAKNRLERALIYAQEHENPETNNLSGTAVNEIQSAIDNANKSISVKGRIDNPLDPYTLEEATVSTPEGRDPDSCDDCGSDDSGCSDCASDTADCIS